MKFKALTAFVLLAFAGNAVADFQGSTHLLPYDEETINYSKTEDQSTIARLKKLVESGEVKLDHDPVHGYLPSLLKELKVPASSQMLVFSKTSFQRERIDPKHPRALYFNDDVYIGYVQGSPMLELTGVDKKLGAVFYTFSQDKVERPKFERNDQCLECHASAKSMGVPGHLVRSFATDESGIVDLRSGTSQVSHRTPIEDRWGGWYVTGEHGQQLHRGNLFGKEAFKKQEEMPNHLGNLKSLEQFFDVSKYLSGSSDIVALMVMEHQTHMQNFITRLNYEATIALQQYGHVRYMKTSTEAFLKYLLFLEEAPLASPIKGNSQFTAEFAALGPKDGKGRSLRELDLRERMFKYPCSYVIYSEVFDAMPEPLKDVIYQRLWDILNGKETKEPFASMPEEDRRAIREILAETKEGLPAYWRKSLAQR
jgi:hypothetical protein